MPYQDFRQFLDTLRQQGELIDVNRRDISFVMPVRITGRGTDCIV